MAHQKNDENGGGGGGGGGGGDGDDDYDDCTTSHNGNVNILEQSAPTCRSRHASGDLRCAAATRRSAAAAGIRSSSMCELSLPRPPIVAGLSRNPRRLCSCQSCAAGNQGRGAPFSAMHGNFPGI